MSKRNGLKKMMGVTVKSEVFALALGLCAAAAGAGVEGRYVRLEIPPRLSIGEAGRTMVFHEVEVISGGRNVALQGAARQSANSRGPASQAIDGNRQNFTHSKVRDSQSFSMGDVRMLNSCHQRHS